MVNVCKVLRIALGTGNSRKCLSFLLQGRWLWARGTGGHTGHQEEAGQMLQEKFRFAPLIPLWGARGEGGMGCIF